ncbi:MAG TPA: glycosyl hydrolase [Candidatus Saccharimonadales bacterium]|nr:glycosyl hydrolase [Candidatus Saccharimonadales bacterium]
MKGLLKGEKIVLLAGIFTVVVAIFFAWVANISRSSEIFYSQTGCTVSTQLVNSCRAWLGATAGGYAQVGSDLNTQLNFFNKRLNDASVLTDASKSVAIDKKMDIAHVYHPQGTNLFSGSASAVLNNNSFPYVFVNWKPLPAGYKWKDANGSNSTVNNYIAQGAQAVKGLGSRKIFLTIWHEPENDVSSGNCTSNAGGASMGSPSEYVDMWRNVRSIFDAQGVGNVVWVMNYMGFSNWDCLVAKLYPGNAYVDWIVYDQYGSGTTGFNASVERFYNFLSNNSNNTTNYNSKIWGLAEHGYNNVSSQSNDARARDYWTEGKNAVLANKFPKIKMWVVFDTSTNGSSRVGYNFSGGVDVAEQTEFNGFATAVLGVSAPTAPPPPPPSVPTPPPPTEPTPTNPTPTNPTPTVPSPSPNSPSPAAQEPVTSSGAINVAVIEQVQQGEQVVVDAAALAAQEIVVRTEYYVNGRLTQVLTEPPFAFDTGLLLPGDHTITQHTYFSDGSGMVRSESVTIEHAKPNSSASAQPKTQWQIALAYTLPTLGVVGAITVLFVLFRRGILHWPL